MTPNDLAKSGSEHGVQRALFGWCRMAEAYGFEAAWDEAIYFKDGFLKLKANPPLCDAVPELRWFHAIPNGGSRGDSAASRSKQGGALKAEGVKRGIPDTFLPLPLWGATGNTGLGQLNRCIVYAGLYIEMKRPESLTEGKRGKMIVDRAAGTTSEDQDSFIAYARRNAYAVSVCFSWDDAARELQKYITACRQNS